MRVFAVAKSDLDEVNLVNDVATVQGSVPQWFHSSPDTLCRSSKGLISVPL